MINWFDVSDESPNKDLALKNLKVTQNGTYGESGVAYSSVEVNVSGGSSSDLSTAIVTYTTDQMTPLFLNHIDDNINGINPTMLRDGEYSVILYKQKAIGVWRESFEDLTVETTGNITVDLDARIFTITGDGTISIL